MYSNNINMGKIKEMQIEMDNEQIEIDWGRDLYNTKFNDEGALVHECEVHGWWVAKEHNHSCDCETNHNDRSQ